MHCARIKTAKNNEIELDKMIGEINYNDFFKNGYSIAKVNPSLIMLTKAFLRRKKREAGDRLVLEIGDFGRDKILRQISNWSKPLHLCFSGEVEFNAFECEFIKGEEGLYKWRDRVHLNTIYTACIPLVSEASNPIIYHAREGVFNHDNVIDSYHNTVSTALDSDQILIEYNRMPGFESFLEIPHGSYVLLLNLRLNDDHDS
jgi:hypothetical protein